MKLVTYLLRQFLPIFFGSLGLFVFILTLVDLLMNLWSYINFLSPVGSIAQVVFLYTPKAVSFSLPIAVLFSTAYCLSSMYARNELIIIFTSGVRLLRFVFPLLLFSFILSFGLFFFENEVVVPTYSQKVALQDELLQRTVDESNVNVTLQSARGLVVYKADYYDDINKRLIDVTIVTRTEDFKLDKIVRSENATWIDTVWRLKDPIMYSYDDGELSKVQIDRDFLATLDEPPDSFKNNDISIEEMNVSDSKEYIDYLRRTGLPSAQAETEYFKKFSFPFVLFIVVFLSVGLSGKTKKNVLPVSLVLSVCATVLFYITQMITTLLAEFGYLSPLIGAWFPIILFVIISSVLLYYSHT